MERKKVLVFSAGMTGLADGCASGVPVYEAVEWPEGWRGLPFEIGGGR